MEGFEHGVDLPIHSLEEGQGALDLGVILDRDRIASGLGLAYQAHLGTLAPGPELLIVCPLPHPHPKARALGAKLHLHEDPLLGHHVIQPQGHAPRLMLGRVLPHTLGGASGAPAHKSDELEAIPRSGGWGLCLLAE